MDKPKVTIVDIAKRVGKSITTVSRALHDYPDVSPETKQLVRRTAIEMGYTPSTLAQRLQKQRTETIGLILPTFGPRFSDPFFSELLAGIGNKAAEYGYDLLVSTRPPGEMEIEAYRQIVNSRRVDGFILVRTRLEDARANFLRATRFPFVSFGRTASEQEEPFVDEDSRSGMSMLTRHLLSLGYRRFAFITAPSELTFSRHRLEGIQQELAAHGLSIPDGMILTGDLTQRGGYLHTRQMISSSKKPDVIMACNDLMALGAISAIQEAGLVVGKDIAVTGFDDIPMAEHSHPPLTTMRQPIYQIGARVCDMLVRILQGEHLQETQIIMQPQLVVRQSCGSSAQPGNT